MTHRSIITETASPEQTGTAETGETPVKARFQRRGQLRLALIAGVLLTLANPPAGLWPLAWIALVPLIISITSARTFRQAVWRGYLFGWTFLGPTWYWIGLTISGWTSSNIGWFAWFGLTLVLALFYSGWGGLAWWLSKRTDGFYRALAIAASWVVMEWMRSMGTVGMPWAQVAYTQAKFLPIAQIAELTGALGVSGLIVFFNAGVADVYSRRGNPNQFRNLAIAIGMTILCAVYGFARMREAPVGKPLRVAAIQGDFKMTETEADIPEDRRKFSELTAKAMGDPQPPTLLVWSESAAPGDGLHNDLTRSFLANLANEYDATILVGSRVVDNDGSETNSGLLFSPDIPEIQRYDKRQLVPFGEFIPMRSLIPEFIKKSFQFFPIDVTRGSGSMVLTGNPGRPVRLGTYICYESMYPQYPRQATVEGADLLVTLSNDAWFHSRAAKEQHLQAVQFRSIENQRDTVRATTNGVTCFVDSKGRIMKRAPEDCEAVIVGTVHLRSAVTFYQRYNDWFYLVCLASLPILVILGTKPKKEEEAV